VEVKQNQMKGFDRASNPPIHLPDQLRSETRKAKTEQGERI